MEVEQEDVKLDNKNYMKQYRVNKKQNEININKFLLKNLTSKAIRFTNQNGVILSYANYLMIEELEDNDISIKDYNSYFELTTKKSTFRTNYSLDFIFNNIIVEE